MKPNPDLSQDVHAAVYLELGDAYIARNKPKKAAKYYSQGVESGHTEPSLIAMSGNVVVRRRVGWQLAAGFSIPLLDRDSDLVVAQDRSLDGDIDEIQRRTVIGKPFQFFRGSLIRDLNLRRVNFSRITMVFDFTVTSAGRVGDVEIIESNAPPKLDKFMLKAFRKVRYRPALAAGEPVDAKTRTADPDILEKKSRRKTGSAL